MICVSCGQEMTADPLRPKRRLCKECLSAYENAKAETPAPASVVRRKKRLAVGQCWRASFIEGTDVQTGYAFELIYESSYWKPRVGRLPCWLGIKRYLQADISNEGGRIFWFDETGLAVTTYGFEFQLTRKQTSADIPKLGIYNAEQGFSESLSH